jgi:prepilin signal peptidase PulO-like enzyme (type II secretory pathway)
VIVLAALVGLILGSFANVVIYRLPRGSIMCGRACRTDSPQIICPFGF